MLSLINVTVTRGAKKLIEKINLQVYQKQVIGLIGANGCGKSTLFSVIKGDHDYDAGNVEVIKNIKIQYLAQETPGLEISALEYTYSGDAVLYAVLTKLAKAELEQDDETIMKCHVRLNDLDGYRAEARASKILIGLGFTQAQLNQPVKSFSGGWRMRLNLAKCLFAPADLLLLDEPTNHLDMEAIIWLENYLQHYQGAIIVVSHDRDFLDQIVTHIAHIENQGMKVYTGNYSYFEVERANAIALQHAQYQKQQNKINHLMHFVERFRAKASKAKQAQSRLKALEKMELVQPVHESLPFTFAFKEPAKMPNPMITMQRVTLGYESNTVIKNINFNVTAGQRIGLLGVNGAGKSTLIKGICGSLTPQLGEREQFSGTKIGYFAQHQVDHLRLDESPLSLLKDLAPNHGEKELISYLGSFNFNRDQSLSALASFSGGEKARIALALIIWQRPNLLLLDEPTNHIDMEVRQALLNALQLYKGALILVSHDRYLMRALVDELYLIENNYLNQFQGSVEDYQHRSIG